MDYSPEVDAMTLRDWRHAFHQQPETAFDEHRTSTRIAEILQGAGLEVVTGLGGGTGVIAILDGKRGGDHAIGLRADIDALDITELNHFSHVSTMPGKMHACGHDGHTTMLLGAACTLVRDPDFSGRVYFIFQPAEENQGGGRVMVEEERLFDHYAMRAVYGLHNWPGLAVGEAAVHETAVMAAFDVFSLTLTGRGCHAAMPNQGTDAILAACQLVTQLQGVVSREIRSHQSAVLSVTQFHAGDTYNVVPGTVELRGTVRYFDADVQAHLQRRFRECIDSIACFYGLDTEFDYKECYPATINTPKNAARCSEVLEALPQITKIHRDLPSSMASEDFAFMLRQRPGAYIWLGNGEDSASLHNPYYDFNDDIAPIGVAYWLALVKSLLSD